MIATLVYIIGSVIEGLVGLRFVFRLLGADPSSMFVSWVYNWSTPLVAPFAGIFGQNAIITGSGAVAHMFDPSALVAFIIYGIIFTIVSSVFMRHVR